MSLKSVVGRSLPRWARTQLLELVVDRFNRAALRRFQKAHQPTRATARDWRNGLAVVLPCYNHAAYLGDTFASIVNQTYRPFDLICVEDHSTDDSLARLQALCRQLPDDIHPTLLRTPRNMGQAFALNLGITASQASVLMVLNDDDYLMHDAIEATVEILRRNTDLFLFGTTCVRFSSDQGLGVASADRFIRNSHPDYATIPLIRYSPTDVPHFTHADDLNMTHSGSTFFRTAWQAVGGYFSDKSKRVVAFSDRDFQLRVTSLFPTAVSMSVPFVFWRTDGSVDRGRNS